MSIEHIVIENGDALITRVTGQLTGEEMTEHMFWLIDNFGKRLNPGYRQLFDTTDMIDLSVNKSDINRISQIIQTYGADRGKIKTGIRDHAPQGAANGLYLPGSVTRHRCGCEDLRYSGRGDRMVAYRSW